MIEAALVPVRAGIAEVVSAHTSAQAAVDKLDQDEQVLKYLQGQGALLFFVCVCVAGKG
jgi:hypothetical protein